MKKILILIAIVNVVSASSVKDILYSIDNSPKVKSAKYLSKAAYESYLSALGNKMPRVDLSYIASYSKEYPSIKMRLPKMLPINARVGLKKHFIGEIRVAYPLFSGFAISSMIDKANWKAKEAKLRVQDLKRNLYLKAIDTFSKIDAINAQIKALKKAQNALESGYKKADGLYKAGLIAQSELFRIKAQLFGIKANITNLEAQKKSLLNLLGYITGTKVKRVQGRLHLKRLPRLSTFIAKAYANRSDLLAIKAQIEQKRADISLAKSQNYPQINAIAALKKEGDNFKLTKNDFSNINKSYVGVQMKWNIFNGGKTKHQIEAAKYLKLAKSLEYNDYKNLIKMQIKNAKNELNSIYAMLKEAKAELKARQSYYNLSKGRFQNGLISADEFANAIASWANAKANYQTILAKLTTQKAKLWLLAGLDSFREAIK